MKSLPGIADCLWVGLGGALGTGLRFTCAMTWPVTDPTSLPLATLGVNVAGSMLIGVFAALALARGMDFGSPRQLFLMVGFCGGLTTFSFVGLESAMLVQHGHWLTLASYLCLSLLGWLGGIACGFLATLGLVKRRSKSG